MAGQGGSYEVTAIILFFIENYQNKIFICKICFTKHFYHVMYN